MLCRSDASWFADNYMQANPAKSQLLAFGDAFYSSGQEIGKHHIESSHRVKILGIYIERTLIFKTHVDEICRRADKRLGALGRLCNIISYEGTLTVLKTFIFSQFNFCPVIWHFCGITDIKKLEKVQERGLRIVFIVAHTVI